jgi:hypothetical protein
LLDITAGDITAGITGHCWTGITTSASMLDGTTSLLEASLLDRHHYLSTSLLDRHRFLGHHHWTGITTGQASLLDRHHYWTGITTGQASLLDRHHSLGHHH